MPASRLLFHARSSQYSKTIMEKEKHEHWLTRIHEWEPISSRAAEHDTNGSFVSENYEALKRIGFLAATVPEELGGGGVSDSTMCDLLRSMAQYCSSTALAQSMHQHLVATNVWRYRHRQGRVEMLRAVAAKQARPVRILPRENRCSISL